MESDPHGATCACTLIQPCSDVCSCANPLMSGGCARCCTYGSPTQKKAAALYIARALAQYLPLKSKYKVLVITMHDGELEYLQKEYGLDIKTTKGSQDQMWFDVELEPRQVVAIMEHPAVVNLINA